MSTNIQAIMESVDDIKLKITDAEYKKLCDKIMILNKQDSGKITKNYYKITYIDTVFTQRQDTLFEMKCVTKTISVRMKPRVDVEVFRSRIIRDGIVNMTIDDLYLPMESTHINIRTDDEHDEALEDSDDYERGHTFTKSEILTDKIMVLRIDEL